MRTKVMKDSIMDVRTIPSNPPVMNSLWVCTVYASSPVASKYTIVHFLSADCRASQEKKHRNDPGGRGIHGELRKFFRGLIRDCQALFIRVNMVRGTEDPQVYKVFLDAVSPGIRYGYWEVHDHNICWEPQQRHGTHDKIFAQLVKMKTIRVIMLLKLRTSDAVVMIPVAPLNSPRTLKREDWTTKSMSRERYDDAQLPAFPFLATFQRIVIAPF